MLVAIVLLSIVRSGFSYGTDPWGRVSLCLSGLPGGVWCFVVLCCTGFVLCCVVWWCGVVWCGVAEWFAEILDKWRLLTLHDCVSRGWNKAL